MKVDGIGDLAIHPLNAKKEPTSPHGFYDAKRMEPPRAWALVGVAAGAVNGLDCLDIDPAGVAWYEQNFDALPATRANATPRGVHLLFRHAPGLRCSNKQIAPGVDIKADGGYFIWWPREGLPFDNHPLCDWPGWLLKEAMDACKAGHGQRGLVERAPLHCMDANLSKLDPVNYRNFDDWLRLTMACHAAGIDREAFVAWSTSDPCYADHGDKIRRIWNSLKPDGGITAATLFRELKGEPVLPPPPVPKHRPRMTPRDKARIESIAGCVARSAADEELLFWAACRYGEARMAIVMRDEMLERLLMGAAWQSGLRNRDRMQRQIRNGLRIGSEGKGQWRS